ncbi:MAG: pentapeptide repeat-containing protein [Proteobacteria bacterium]|nr:pentapeptide repeat-containing protein [Pseudomonadota bacterium]
MVFGCILGNRWGGVVMRALLVDGRHISGVVYVGLGIVICGWGLWGCRSVGSSGNAQLQSQPEVGRGHRIEVLAKNCQYTHNDVEIRGYCHPKTSQCDKNQDIGAVSILECSRAKISGMDLSGRNLRYANFTESDLNGVKLNNSDLLGAHGEWATFQGVLADGADFSHAKLIGTEFRFAVLDKSLFLGAELLKARFDGAKLNDVDFHSANLRGASFRKALLRGSRFTNAYLKDADFKGAHLYGVDFSGAQHLDTVDFSEAVNLDKARGLDAGILNRFASKDASP